MKNYTSVTETVPFTYQENGADPVEYHLREMTSAERDVYLDSIRERTLFDAAGKVIGMKKVAGIHADLLHLCIRKPDGGLVAKDAIQKWPATMVGDLFSEASRLNQLNAGPDADTEKNV